MSNIADQIREITATIKISSQLISGADFNLKKLLDNPKTNTEMYNDLAGKSKNKVLKSFGDKAELIELGQKIFILDHENKRIDYYVQYEFSNIKKYNGITQIAIWAASISAFTKIADEPSVMKNTFFNILLPKADCIVADSLQTDDGMRFWLRRLTEAIGMGLHIFVYSRSDNKIYKAESVNNLREAQHKIWGKGDAFMYKRALISQQDLFPDALPLTDILK
jgi:CRISPR/Cas system CMR-associated protein Cmr1 (group 7 of RAMP superfamily)